MSKSASLWLFLACAIGASAQTYQIRIDNLTTSQPFSPPVFATHSGSERLFQLGSAASPGVTLVAEEGDRSVLLADLNSRLGTTVGQIEAPLAGPLMPGESVTVTVMIDPAHPFLSAVWMLGRTNDGISGYDSLDLSTMANAGVYLLNSYDAGTELNNELASHLPALGGTMRAPENGVVHMHGGILGIADAPASWDWNDPVARLTVTVVPEPGTLATLAIGFGGLLFSRRRR